MNRLVVLYKDLELNFGKVLIYLFAIALYLPMIFTNIISIALVVCVLFNYKKIDFAALVKNRSFIYLSFFYFIVLLGFSYEISANGVLNDLEKKLSFLVFPIAVSLMKINKNDLKNILALLFFCGFLFTSFAFCIGLFKFAYIGELKILTHHSLSHNIGLHATYLSIYLLFSLAFPMFFFDSIKSKSFRWVIVLCAAGILFYILLLSVRMAWILLFLTFIFQISLGLKGKKIKWIDAFMYSSGVLLISAVLIMNINPLKERFKEAINYNNEFNVEKVWGGRGIRMLIWESCFTLIKESPIVGYGSSKEVQQQLNSVYRKENIGQLLYMMRNHSKVFNPHNQYLEEILKFGLVLGLAFPFFLLTEFVYFYKVKNLIGFYFVMIIAGVALTETILELNKGIVFFSCFLPVLHSIGSISNEAILKTKEDL